MVRDGDAVSSPVALDTAEYGATVATQEGMSRSKDRPATSHLFPGPSV